MHSKAKRITPFLMFDGQAKEAIEKYTSLLPNSDIQNIVYHEDGTVLHATFVLSGQLFMAIDNKNGETIPFTSAISLFIECESLEEIEKLFSELAKEGKVLMPLGPLPFSEKFGWVQDKYGVTWQLNIAKEGA